MNHIVCQEKFSYQTKHIGTNKVQRAISYVRTCRSLLSFTENCVCKILRIRGGYEFRYLI